MKYNLVDNGTLEQFQAHEKALFRENCEKVRSCLGGSEDSSCYQAFQEAILLASEDRIHLRFQKKG